jgi:DNA-directed RNA polymerase subunit M/transcription elongation factor TFIIS
MDRETGTQTQPCPNCGSALAVVELEDGATSTVLCQTCYGPAKTEKAAAPVVEREYGVKDEVKDEEDGDDD